MEFVYPAIFHSNANDGSFTITYPDLPGCISEGKSLGHAIAMAQDALYGWLEYHVDKKKDIPPASSINSISLECNEIVNLIRVELKLERAVKRTVSLPRWMDDRVLHEGLSLSRVLQDALSAKFA